MWRHLLQEPAIPKNEATLVCVDLPGFGGSDSFKVYDTEVLEALTEFIVAMRDRYIPAEETEVTNTFIVGHDWGCVLGFRLATDAPCLADRFILTNAPHVNNPISDICLLLLMALDLGRTCSCKQGPHNQLGLQDLQAVQTVTQATLRLPVQVHQYAEATAVANIVDGLHIRLQSVSSLRPKLGHRWKLFISERSQQDRIR